MTHISGSCGEVGKLNNHNSFTQQVSLQHFGVYKEKKMEKHHTKQF